MSGSSIVAAETDTSISCLDGLILPSPSTPTPPPVRERRDIPTELDDDFFNLNCRMSGSSIVAAETDTSISCLDGVSPNWIRMREMKTFADILGVEMGVGCKCQMVKRDSVVGFWCHDTGNIIACAFL
ncbi:hypothetical protein CEXT_86961 [Caerostris extrusa]|uniref:Uncharacterized protein n=1 Tax=Caerostris extrusa TaxID=172846 RepID=A0AAV4SNW5_CAEEX|nr:hypothetical protein CEXT_86961 [Caerostris extrusa]